MKKEYRFLSFVDRWAIAPRHHRQSVAEHSFYTALYASEICSMLRVAAHERAIVIDVALRHDVIEVWESDIPGPAKRSIVDDKRHDEYKKLFAEGMGDLYRRRAFDADSRCVNVWMTDESLGAPVIVTPSQIVKVADLVDEIFFLAMEMQLGNNLVRGLYQKELSRLDQAAVSLGGDKFAEELIQTVGTEIARLGDEGAIIPFNDDDVNGKKP